ncbi:amidohydrolase [Bacillus sp. T33-2]|uniref:amidohydrolase n=1 Tax=Bacillus sp. T33-2 TaxID=2054168 RepID=UPI000C7776BD|nr:amidohydrolase [Bacillus sp. T33-2]PLR98151.1 amidohydrolase [Bacillus sp. T33-2]
MGTLWYGGNIYTMQNEGHQTEAVFTKGSRIVGVGAKNQLETQYDGQIHKRVDLMGCTMIPGLVDSHIHLIGHGESLIRLDLSRCTSKQEVLDAVHKYALSLEDGEWVIGEGWNENLWETPAPLHRSELDSLIPDRPVILKRVCRHALVANSMALEKAAVTAQTECPAGGVIERDLTGDLTGLLKDQAQDLVTAAIPKVSLSYVKTALRAAIKDAYRLGLTGVHTEDLNYYGSASMTYDAFRQVIIGEGLPFKAHLLVHHEVADEAANFTVPDSGLLELGAVKIFADGALGGRTALLSHPYADDPSTSGVAIHTHEGLKKLVENARKLNKPVAIHTIGDLAFEYALDAIEAFPHTGTGRDRLIHAQILNKELVDRVKNLPVILDIQPRFVSSDFPWVIERIGAENMEYCYAWKTLIDEGIHCAGGSDAPIEPADPLLGIHAAVTRTRHGDSEKTAYMPEQALSAYEAVSLFTKGSAYAAGHEKDRGIITIGYTADFTVFKEDIFNTDPHLIPEINIEMTVVNGNIVFERIPDLK